MQLILPRLQTVIYWTNYWRVLSHTLASKHMKQEAENGMYTFMTAIIMLVILRRSPLSWHYFPASCLVVSLPLALLLHPCPLLNFDVPAPALILCSCCATLSLSLSLLVCVGGSCLAMSLPLPYYFVLGPSCRVLHPVSLQRPCPRGCCYIQSQCRAAMYLSPFLLICFCFLPCSCLWGLRQTMWRSGHIKWHLGGFSQNSL